MAGGIVESAAAGYQSEGCVVRRVVNGFRRKTGFGVLAYASDAEHSRDPVGERTLDGVPGAEGPKAEEDSGPLITVDVTFDDRRPDLAGRRRVLVPCRHTGTRFDRRYLDRAVGVDSQVQKFRVHANGGAYDGNVKLTRMRRTPAFARWIRPGFLPQRVPI